MPRFQDIPQMTIAHYSVTRPWRNLAENLEKWGDRDNKLDLNPEYQRGNVWTKKQKTAYIEYIMRGGISGRDIFWNCPGWMNDFRGPMELVDGKQRVTAVLEFQENKFKVFGHYFREYTDKLDWVRHHFLFYVNDLENREDIIQWYLDLNSGMPHKRKDIQKAENLLNELKSETN
jgi:hypothetical protein